MTRRTSKEAYDTIKQNGLLGNRQWKVYDALYRRGPMTANQVYELLKSEDSISWISNQGAGSRLSELRNMGCVYEVGNAIDPFTKMSVILWDVTDEKPRKLERKIPKDKIIADLKARISFLEDQIEHFKGENARLLRGELF